MTLGSVVADDVGHLAANERHTRDSLGNHRGGVGMNRGP